jgi:SAM-dependent methyltransferase
MSTMAGVMADSLAGALPAGVACPVCSGVSRMLDVVDLHKCCLVESAKGLPLAGVPIYYYQCPECLFCHAEQMYGWSLQNFADLIYNDDYVRFDPEYLEKRPRSNAQLLIQQIGPQAAQIRHLDYGGGDGLLSRVLGAAGWQSSSWDPFVNPDITPESLGQFDLITAFEVFEHVPDVVALVTMLSGLLKPDGVVIFSTLVLDGQVGPGQRLTWWYASPRNGHISLFSRKSLVLLGNRVGFRQGSFSDGLHAYWRSIPAWASHFMRERPA